MEEKTSSWKRKKGFAIGSLVIVSFFFLCLPMGVDRAEAAPDKVRLSIGGASSGTWIYMFCATLSEVWKRYVPDVDVTVLATAGTTANYIPMSEGKLDLAGATTPGDYWAMHGMYFARGKKITNFCSMLPATIGLTQFFTYADSPIKSYKDLNGKTLQVGARASPTSGISEEICKALGVKPKFIFSTPSEAIEMVKDRRVDAMMYNVGAPWGGLMDAGSARQLKLISMTDAELKSVLKGTPWGFGATIPAKTYPWQTKDIRTFAFLQTVNARPGLAVDIVYKLTKAAWEHWDEVVKAAKAAQWVKPENILNMVAPVHPGAAKYYEEKGIKIPERLIWKKK
jgi:TRAP transporter TAXI family solute receptor